MRKRADRDVRGGTVRHHGIARPGVRLTSTKPAPDFSTSGQGTASMVSNRDRRRVAESCSASNSTTRIGTAFSSKCPTKGGGVRYAHTTVPAPPFSNSAKGRLQWCRTWRVSRRCWTASGSPSRTAKPLFFNPSTSPGRDGGVRYVHNRIASAMISPITPRESQFAGLLSLRPDRHVRLVLM